MRLILNEYEQLPLSHTHNLLCSQKPKIFAEIYIFYC